MSIQIGGQNVIDNSKNIVNVASYSGPGVATQGEAEAGTNNDQLMTPLRVAQAIAALGGGEKMKLEVLILSGGGGASRISSTPTTLYNGGGGGGAVFYGYIDAEPGTTLRIGIGAGGAVGSLPPACPPTCQACGSRGGDSYIRTCAGTTRVVGGGGGAQSGAAVHAAGPWHGGTGGGGGNQTTLTCCTTVGFSSPGNLVTYGEYGISGGRSVYASGYHRIGSVSYPFGALCQYTSWTGPTQMASGGGSFFGGPGAGWHKYPGPSPSVPCIGGSSAGGGAGGSAVNNGAKRDAAGKGYFSEITGSLEYYGEGSTGSSNPCSTQAPSTAFNNTGKGGWQSFKPPSCPGGPYGAVPGYPGTVVVRYPTCYSASPSTPGGTNCSPQTPGYYTYKYNSTGSLTLP